MDEKGFCQLPEDKSSGPRPVSHPKFLVSRCFSDISDCVPVLELLGMGKGRGGSWVTYWDRTVPVSQKLESLVSNFPGQLGLLKLGEGTHERGLGSLVLMTQRCPEEGGSLVRG